MRVAFLTAGGLAPCLSASIAYLIKEYAKLNDSIEFFGYAIIISFKALGEALIITVKSS